MIGGRHIGKAPHNRYTARVSSILVIIPSFNERQNILSLLERLFALGLNLHVLVVDDSSPDGTADVLREGQKQFPDELYVIVRKGKGGRGSAVLDGFRWALRHSYDIIFEMDADFSHEPSEIPRFLEQMKQSDMVVGSRYLPESKIHEWGMKRTVFSFLANKYARFVLGIPMTDYTNGYRCYRRSTLEMIDMDHIDAKGYVVLSEVAWQLHKKGATIGEVPTIFVNRRRGISNLTSKEIQEAFLSVLRIRSPRLYVHVKQGIKFIMSGGIGSLIDMVSLTAFVALLKIHPNVAFYLSSFCGAMTVFFLNKHITFRNKEKAYRKQIAKFWMVYGPAIFLNGVISTILRAMGVPYLLAKAIAIGLLIPINYMLSHGFIFRKKHAHVT